MVYHTFRNANYNAKAAGRRRRKHTRRRRARARKTGTRTIAKRALALANKLRTPRRYIEWTDASQLMYETYGSSTDPAQVAASKVIHFKTTTDDAGYGAISSGYIGMVNQPHIKYNFNWKQHPFPIASRVAIRQIADAAHLWYPYPIRPRSHINTDVGSEELSIGSTQWKALFDADPDSVTDGACFWDALFDNGISTLQINSQARYNETLSQIGNVCAISSPINLLPVESNNESYNNPYIRPPGCWKTRSRMIVDMNFRIRDHMMGITRNSISKRDFSGQVLVCHVYLVKYFVGQLDASADVADAGHIRIDPGNPALMKVFHGADDEALSTNDAYGLTQANNDTTRGFVVNMFKEDATLLEDLSNRMFRLTTRDGAMKQMRQFGYTDPVPETVGAATTNQHSDRFQSNCRRYPFKIVEHKSFRLGAKSSADPLAIYEKNVQFRVNTTNKWRVEQNFENDAGKSMHQLEDVYRVVVVHNGAPIIFPCFSHTKQLPAKAVKDAGPNYTFDEGSAIDGSGGVIDPTSSEVDASANNRATLLCATRVRHAFEPVMG